MKRCPVDIEVRGRDGTLGISRKRVKEACVATPPPLLEGGEGVRGREGTLGNSRNGDEGHRILKGLDLAVCAVCCSKRSAAMRNISAS